MTRQDIHERPFSKTTFKLQHQHADLKKRWLSVVKTKINTIAGQVEMFEMQLMNQRCLMHNTAVVSKTSGVQESMKSQSQSKIIRFIFLAKHCTRFPRAPRRPLRPDRPRVPCNQQNSNLKHKITTTTHLTCNHATHSDFLITKQHTAF